MAFSLRSRAAAAVLQLIFTILIGCVLCSGSATVEGHNDRLPQPSWSRTCTSPYEVCSTIEVYQYWEEKKNRLSFTVDAMMKDPNAKNVLTVWMLMDDPNVNVAKDIFRENINVVIVRPRGSKQTPSFMTCPNTSNPYNKQCWMSEACAAELAAAASSKSNPLNMSHYSANQVAHDLDWALRTLGDGRPNVVLGQGLSSMLVLRLLQYHQDTKAAVVLLDYVHPLMFDVYNYFGGGSMVAALQHVLTMCDDQAACVGRLGAAEGSWNRLLTVIHMAKEGKLSCASRLKWGPRKGGNAAFADKLHEKLALMLRYPVYPFLASKPGLLNLIPSLLYRVQRCNKKDVEALNKLHDYLSAAKNYECPESVALHMHWLVNEFLQAAPPSSLRSFRSSAAAKHLILPPFHSLSAFHDAVKKFPRISRSAESKKLPVNATQSILLLTADADALLPEGAASQVALSFRQLGDSVQLRQLRGIVNHPCAVLTPCLVNNLKMFRDHGVWADEDQCTLDVAHKIDFINGATDIYYGTGDAWDFDKPNSDETNGGRDDDEGGFHFKWRFIARALLALLLLGGIGAAGYFAFTYLKTNGPFHYSRVSDNFYENLHQ
ncbi:conserved hypothetical protein [Leishmania mexicana MHOM/GT/2001/U1103]|uniref:AB hydrolase-1 domain-containing protein n=1 Tax=Leishmania mexicana (strain MHOM/GT/2001/U1103) TaxID=929439 RepID=E9B3C3_LEIMU|nr:conserved hypothetical protein [Leishmania mexicana MHOM/GT/2001/U1103]CBZ29740.1 conserved hypothetical protein [Leishmania mexicana MHOM/GT/2001/U1103]